MESFVQQSIIFLKGYISLFFIACKILSRLIGIEDMICWKLHLEKDILLHELCFSKEKLQHLKAYIYSWQQSMLQCFPGNEYLHI